VIWKYQGNEIAVFEPEGSSSFTEYETQPMVNTMGRKNMASYSRKLTIAEETLWKLRKTFKREVKGSHGKVHW
jgi:hypothetical protein